MNKPTYDELEKRIKELGKAETKCKKAENALRRSEEQFKKLF